MHMWKWNLAFQCIVNIGVRGSETVRTRVVEADMVPVIATILWDYILVIEREKAKADAEKAHRLLSKSASNSKSSRLHRDALQEAGSRAGFYEHQLNHSDSRQARRQAPPPSLDLPQSFSQAFNPTESNGPHTGPSQPTVLTSPPERTAFIRPPLHHNRSHEARSTTTITNHSQPPATAVPSTETTDVFSLRPVRDIDRLPSMLPPLNTGLPSNPTSPTTPSAPAQQRGVLSPVGRRLRRLSLRHQISASESDDVAMEDVNTPTEETMIEQQTRAHNLRARVQVDTGLERGDDTEEVRVEISDDQPPQEDNVNIAQQTPTDPTVINSILPQPDDRTGTSPVPNGTATIASPAIPLNAYPNLYLRSTTSNASANALMPRDEDVLMGLQLLAYISKYCDLRHYFQATHLVPRLRIDREIEKIYGPMPGHEPMPEPTEDEFEEFLQPNDYNIFPLVEKFTVPHHPKDMSYWACVVMRNLCRKDDAKGGIRQCANYQCGKWEEFTRQFAKCRRCRRTKYCSKVSFWLRSFMSKRRANEWPGMST